LLLQPFALGLAPELSGLVEQPQSAAQTAAVVVAARST
jgi:hypothetical protein